MAQVGSLDLHAIFLLIVCNFVMIRTHFRFWQRILITSIIFYGSRLNRTKSARF